MPDDNGVLRRDEEIPSEMGEKHCRESTKVFCDETDPEVVSVDHSGKRYDFPENASRLGSTSRR